MHVVVHGGAGSAPDEPARRQRALDAAAADGAGTDSPLSAVCTAVRILERDPRFNAGVGSTVQSDGVIRTDASVMTDEGLAGAACAMPGVEHAVEVARAVAVETPHVLLAGDPAVAFADEVGVETGCDLWTDQTRAKWNEADPPIEASPAEQLSWIRDRFGAGHDTVGAVATDGERLAAATSTGGRWFALAGRVGDVPQLGAGVYADDRGGASATGEGEAIARYGLAKEAVRRLDKFGPERAASRAVDAFEAETDGAAGVIVLDHDGNAGTAENTEALQTATR